MSEENKAYENNPFKKQKLVIPVSVTSPTHEITQSDDKIIVGNPKEKLSEEQDEGLLEIAALNILMSPILHKKFKTLCVSEGIPMKEKVLDFIKKEVKKSAKNNK